MGSAVDAPFAVELAASSTEGGGAASDPSVACEASVPVPGAFDASAASKGFDVGTPGVTALSGACAVADVELDPLAVLAGSAVALASSAAGTCPLPELEQP